MKKILFIVLDILLLVIICLFMFKGIHIGNIRILSFQEIAESNQKLTQEIAKADEENNRYNEQLSTIKNNVNKLISAKKAYLDLMTVSTDSEIQEALQTKTFSIDYLWSQVGNYATKEGVTIKMEVSSSSVGDNEYRNLNFTVTGNYLAITNFIADLENDSDLDFVIDNFDMSGNGNETCTFVVKDVKIKKEQTTVKSNNSSAVQNNKNKNEGTNDSKNDSSTSENRNSNENDTRIENGDTNSADNTSNAPTN